MLNLTKLIVKKQKIRLLYILILLSVAAMTSLAGLWYPPGNAQDTGANYEILDSSPGRTLIRFRILSADTGSVLLNSVEYDFINIAGLAIGSELVFLLEDRHQIIRYKIEILF